MGFTCEFVYSSFPAELRSRVQGLCPFPELKADEALQGQYVQLRCTWCFEHYQNEVYSPWMLKVEARDVCNASTAQPLCAEVVPVLPQLTRKPHPPVSEHHASCSQQRAFLKACEGRRPHLIT